jgi:hypothetical protein
MTPARAAPGTFAGVSVARQLVRGAIGFGLIGAGFVLTASDGPAALLLILPGMVALRGCPTCWLVGLIQAVSAGRLERSCSAGNCSLTAPSRVRDETLRATVGAGKRGEDILRLRAGFDRADQH